MLHLDLAAQHDDELVPRLPLGREHGAFRFLQVRGEVRDRAELLLRQPGEQRDVSETLFDAIVTIHPTYLLSCVAGYPVGIDSGGSLPQTRRPALASGARTTGAPA